MKESPTLETKVIVGEDRDGWHSFNSEYQLFSDKYERTEDSACGNDLMLMFFTSGTTGYPKIAAHSFKYPLGHFVTANYWHCVNPEGLHFTISDTGWAKSSWGKLYGQWLCEAATFVYDFDRFNASDILPLFKEHNITRMAREESERIKLETEKTTQAMIAKTTGECNEYKKQANDYAKSIVQGAYNFITNGLAGYQGIAAKNLDEINKVNMQFQQEYAVQVKNLGLDN